jgi:hypothetical protein
MVLSYGHGFALASAVSVSLMLLSYGHGFALASAVSVGQDKTRQDKTRQGT